MGTRQVVEKRTILEDKIDLSRWLEKSEAKGGETKMNCQEIIKELHKLAEGKKTDNSTEAVAEAVEIIEDWADKYSSYREDEAKREKMAQTTLRYIPMLIREDPKAWAIWDRKKNSWAESQTGHLFIYVNEEAAGRRTEKLEEADK